jgi:hypothetical protein
MSQGCPYEDQQQRQESRFVAGTIDGIHVGAPFRQFGFQQPGADYILNRPKSFSFRRTTFWGAFLLSGLGQEYPRVNRQDVRIASKVALIEG